MRLTLKSVQFVTVELDYLKELHRVDSEVFYSDSNNYEEKPHVGLLVNNDGFDYVIPLTSAKPKHSGWNDVTATNYLIYEIVPANICDKFDVIKTIKGDTYNVKRIMSVIEIKKMIPVKVGVYHPIDFKTYDLTQIDQLQRYNLLQKEFQFCLNIKSELEEKANQIYKRQMKENKVLPFHCNYQVLERVCNAYQL